MNLVTKLSVVAVLGAACAACSNNNAPAPTTSAPPASSQVPPAPAIPMRTPGASSDAANATRTQGPTFSELMRRPDFAKTFAAMDGASSLPTWVKTGGTSAPSTKVEVAGNTEWLTTACETADCKGAQLLLLVDPVAHTMLGLFVATSGSAGASVQKFTWLGKPGAAVQEFLKDRMSKD